MVTGPKPAEEPALLATVQAGCYFRLLLAWASALAATDFVFADDFGLLKSAEAFFATFALVTLVLLDFAIVFSSFPCHCMALA